MIAHADCAMWLRCSLKNNPFRANIRNIKVMRATPFQEDFHTRCMSMLIIANSKIPTFSHIYSILMPIGLIILLAIIIIAIIILIIVIWRRKRATSASTATKPSKPVAAQLFATDLTPVFPSMLGHSGVLSNYSPQIGETITMTPYNKDIPWNITRDHVYVKRVADGSDSLYGTERYILRYTDSTSGVDAEWHGGNGIVRNESEAQPLMLSRIPVL